MYILNKCTSFNQSKKDWKTIEKQSNKDWNTPIHLENNGPSIKKFLGSFGFLSWLSTYVSITSCVLNRYIYVYIYIYIYIVSSIGHIGQTIHDSQNVCGSLALNEMHIELASLIICLINYNLTNTSSSPPPELKKESIMYSKFNTIVYLEKRFHLLKI